MSRVVVTDSPFARTDLEAAVAKSHRASFAAYNCSAEEETLRATGQAQVVFNNFAPITAKVLAGLAADATVIRYGVGYDNVDIAAATELGVRVSNVPDYGTATVAEHAAALLFALLRRLPHYNATIKADGWCATRAFGELRAFASTTVGLVGTGRIGMALAERLRPFGFKIIAHDPFVSAAALQAVGITPVSFAQVLGESHAVSLHLPLNPATHHLIDATALGLMRSDAVIVNTARGGLVDVRALAAAIESGALAGAGLDVFESEPLDSYSPLRGLDQVILTPHVAFVSADASAKLQRMAAEEADRALSGTDLRNWVNPPSTGQEFR
ncbi:MAG: C-terminal binding protein [Propionibacteriaceae bacterium]|jgi:D-3-phosphoglycerate dehydrogenase|nr:C-terminal binding protein [Propionibacteriaceae bacterium]